MREPTVAEKYAAGGMRQEVCMRGMNVTGLAVVIFFWVQTALGGTIYTWTDADGVKRFSNSQPPEEASQVQTIDEVQTDQSGEDRARQEYDRMVEEASRSADRYLEEQAEKKANEAEAAQVRIQSEQAQRNEAERARLQKELDQIQGRGLSTTFSAGQKEYLINQLKEKMDQLDADTGGYSGQ